MSTIRSEPSVLMWYKSQNIYLYLNRHQISISGVSRPNCTQSGTLEDTRAFFFIRKVSIFFFLEKNALCHISGVTSQSTSFKYTKYLKNENIRQNIYTYVFRRV